MNKVFFSLILFVLILVSCSSKSDQPEQMVSSDPAIVLTEVEVTPVDGADCEIEGDVDIAYMNTSAGAAPEIWWQVVCGEASSMGFKPLKEIGLGDKLIQIKDWRQELAPTSTCSGTCQVYLSIKDGELKSEEWQGVVEFKD